MVTESGVFVQTKFIGSYLNPVCTFFYVRFASYIFLSIFDAVLTLHSDPD